MMRDWAVDTPELDYLRRDAACGEATWSRKYSAAVVYPSEYISIVHGASFPAWPQGVAGRAADQVGDRRRLVFGLRAGTPGSGRRRDG
jgi:hypothetical protein